MIERKDKDPEGEFIIACDECQDEFETGTTNFEAAIRAFKNEGGQVRYSKGDYDHICSDCAASEVEDMFE